MSSPSGAAILSELPRVALTFDEFGALFGLSGKTIKRRVYAGEIRSFHAGPRSQRIPVEEVAAFRQRLLDASIGSLGAPAA